jgi:predicted amidophosphoribosyltransferase
MNVVLPCMHAFCSACIQQWMQKVKTCPICRQDLQQRINRTGTNEIQNSFFELIDLDGKDDVLPDMEV